MSESIPDSWAMGTVGEITAVNPRLPIEPADNTTVGFVPMAAVCEVTGAITKPEERPYGKVKRGYTPMCDGDVIFAKITPCMENGKSAIVRSLPGGLGCGSTEFFVMRPERGIMPEWVHRFVRQASYRQVASEQMNGAVGQARVPRDFLEQSEIPVAPEAEQRRIVAKLDALQSRTRLAREALAAIPALLDHYRQSVLAAAFRGELTAEWRRAKHGSCADDLAACGWRDSTVGAISEAIQYGYTASASNELPGPRFLRITDIQDGHVNWQTVPGCEISPADAAKYRLGKGDIVFARTGATTGKSFLIEDCPEAVFASYLIRLRAKQSEVSPAFLYLFFQSPAYWAGITEVAAGVAQPGCNASKLAELAITLPPVEEQAAIAMRVHRLMGNMRVFAQATGACAKSLGHLDQSLLSTAFRGELVPQDPADEPASRLLDRIRAARSQAGDAPRTRRPRTSAAAPPPARAAEPATPYRATTADPYATLLSALRSQGSISSADAQAATGLGAAAVRQLLQRLVAEGAVKVEGQKRGTRYVAIRTGAKP